MHGDEDGWPVAGFTQPAAAPTSSSCEPAGDALAITDVAEGANDDEDAVPRDTSR